MYIRITHSKLFPKTLFSWRSWFPMTIKKIPLWLDCDPGQDDAVAIILACFHPNFELLGISTTHGNVSLTHTTSNTLRILTALGKTDIPVFPGAKHALDHIPDISAPEIHGKTGLNGSKLLPLARMESRDGSQFYPHLAKLITKYDGQLNIVATGPLTNMALFFKAHPELKSKINWLPVMGGGFHVFNKNGNSEFNFICDPRAANEVMTDSILRDKIILAPLDITSKVFFASDTQHRVLDNQNVDSASNFRAMMFELIDSFDKRMTAIGDPSYKGPVIHDPVALVSLLQFEGVPNELDFKWEQRHFEVGIGGDDDGAIINSTTTSSHGVHVLTDLNVAKFWDLVIHVYGIADKSAYINTLDRKQLLGEYHD